MSRSRRKKKRDKVFPIFETGCPLCDPEARRQIGREAEDRDETKFIHKTIAEDLADYKDKEDK
jgi:hypothetical protein